MRKNCSKDVSREHRIEILFVFGVFLFYFLWSCTQRYNFSADDSIRLHSLSMNTEVFRAEMIH